jgi:hypothetical protein
VLSNAGPTSAPFVSTDTCQAGAAAAGKNVQATADLHETIFPVNDVGTGETLTTGIPGIVAVAWQADDVSADNAAVFCSNTATGAIDFVCENAAIEGYLWIKHRA